MPVEIAGEPQYQCPRRPLLDHPRWFAKVFTAHRYYKEGFLPAEGPPNAQPAKLMSLINIVETVMAEAAEHERKTKTKAGSRTVKGSSGGQLGPAGRHGANAGRT